jgi:hypothetical protein
MFCRADVLRSLHETIIIEKSRSEEGQKCLDRTVSVLFCAFAHAH